MTVTFQNNPQELPAGATVADAVRLLSPYGGEPVAVLLNGAAVDSDASIPLSGGDALAVFPRLIGG